MKRFLALALFICVIAQLILPFIEEGAVHVVAEQSIGEPNYEEQEWVLPASCSSINLIATLIRRKPPVRVKSLRIFSVRPSYHAIALHRSALRSSDIPTFRI